MSKIKLGFSTGLLSLIAIISFPLITYAWSSSNTPVITRIASSDGVNYGISFCAAKKNANKSVPTKFWIHPQNKGKNKTVTKAIKLNEAACIDTTINNLSSNKSYSFKLRVKSGNKWSPWSNQWN